MSFQFPTNYKLSSRQVSGLNNFLKDWRTDEIKNIDTAVLEDFLKICSLCAIENKVLNVNIHSGFRSKKTNEYLRRSSYKVAKIPCIFWEKLSISPFLGWIPGA